MYIANGLKCSWNENHFLTVSTIVRFYRLVYIKVAILLSFYFANIFYGRTEQKVKSGSIYTF